MVIFDLDGTLYRTHETCIPALLSVCEKYRVKVSEEDKQFLMCTTAEQLLDKTAPDMPQEIREQFLDEFKWIEIELVKKNGRLFEHVSQLIRRYYRKYWKNGERNEQ